MNNRALITGISGFTGPYMRTALENAGFDVFGFGHNKTSDSKILNVDLCDYDVVLNALNKIKPNVVVHFAGISNVNYSNINQLYYLNIVGSRNLINALYESNSNIDTVMMVSSANIYGKNISRADFLSEESEISPANDYSISKWAMEQICRLWINKIPIFIVRPFNYTGVGQNNSFIIPKLIEHFVEEKKVVKLGNIDVYREFNNVRQIVEIYTKLINVNPVGKTINVCSGKVYSLREIIFELNDIAGHNIEVVQEKNLLRENDITRLKGSNKLLTSLIGETDFLPINETLKWMYENKVDLYARGD